MKYQREVDEFLTRYPRAMKWINQCVSCQTKGYKPEMPKDEWRNLARYFQPLALGPDGRCGRCAADRQD